MSQKRDKPQSTELTEAQLETLLAFHRLASTRKIAPSVDEISKEVDKAKTTVRVSIRILLRKGYLKREGAHRGLRITRRGALTVARRGDA